MIAALIFFIYIDLLNKKKIISIVDDEKNMRWWDKYEANSGRQLAKF